MTLDQAAREYEELTTEAARAMEWGMIEAAIKQAEKANKK